MEGEAGSSVPALVSPAEVARRRRPPAGPALKVYFCTVGLVPDSRHQDLPGRTPFWTRAGDQPSLTSGSPADRLKLGLEHYPIHYNTERCHQGWSRGRIRSRSTQGALWH